MVNLWLHEGIVEEMYKNRKYTFFNFVFHTASSCQRSQGRERGRRGWTAGVEREFSHRSTQIYTEFFVGTAGVQRDSSRTDDLIRIWLSNKNTIEFLGIWEMVYNTDFNSLEFEGIKNEAGLNRFVLSVKQWVSKTNSIGMVGKAGRYGGT